MKFKEYLIESKSKPLIVVDIQPAYDKYITFNVNELMDFINERTGKILFLINADRDGLTEDTVATCWEYWNVNGLELEKYNRNITVYDKGFGYFRSWMDLGASDKDIIKAIRYMYQKKKHDSRDIPEEEWEKIIDYEDWMEYDPLIVEWISLNLLKEHSRGYICGGGKNECLKEVELMMNAFNLKYKEIKKFIY